MQFLSSLLICILLVHHADCFSASVIVTGPKGKPASSFEEDLRLTMQIIMDHEARSTTTSKEQMLSQMAAVAEVVETLEDVDISIPYDAAAELAFESSDKSMEYSVFREKFEADAVADVISKKRSRKMQSTTGTLNNPELSQVAAVAEVVETVTDVSIPYDAAAKLAFESSDKSMDYSSFREKFEADAVANVISKKAFKASQSTGATSPDQRLSEVTVPSLVEVVETVEALDISIPYDAAAKLAYENSDKSMDYAAFKSIFEAGAVADVVAKKATREGKPTAITPTEQLQSQVVDVVEVVESVIENVDVTIPYDAAAKLAYESSDKLMDTASFKNQFEADAVADVISKKPVCETQPASTAKEEVLSQTASVSVVTEVPEEVDISIPYDAAARLAYEESDKSMDYAEFKTKFEAEAVAAVVAKRSPKVVIHAPPIPQTVDISVPYDAAAKLAYEASDKSSNYEEFRAKYEADAVASVKAKRE